MLKALQMELAEGTGARWRRAWWGSLSLQLCLCPLSLLQASSELGKGQDGRLSHTVVWCRAGPCAPSWRLRDKGPQPPTCVQHYLLVPEVHFFKLCVPQIPTLPSNRLAWQLGLLGPVLPPPSQSPEDQTLSWKT